MDNYPCIMLLYNLNCSQKLAKIRWHTRWSISVTLKAAFPQIGSAIWRVAYWSFYCVWWQQQSVAGVSGGSIPTVTFDLDTGTTRHCPLPHAEARVPNAGIFHRPPSSVILDTLFRSLYFTVIFCGKRGGGFRSYYCPFPDMLVKRDLLLNVLVYVFKAYKNNTVQ